MRPYMGMKDKFVFPAVDDIGEISLHDIRFKLCQPIVNRGRHYFGTDVTF